MTNASNDSRDRRLEAWQPRRVVSAGLRSVAIAVALGAACARSPAPAEDPLSATRAFVQRKDFDGGERLLAGYRAGHGATPALVDAFSVLAQGAIASGDGDRAEALARRTYDLARGALEGRTMDAEPRVPIALGRAIEIIAQATARRGARDEALAFLEGELEAHGGTSVEARIQRNVHLLTLEGSVAPALDLSEYLGATPSDLASLGGRVVLLFFWAHWCADCKGQAPGLAGLVERYAGRGLTVVAPTRRYGYVAAGQPATPAEETPYIEEVRRVHYPALAGQVVPLSESNHRRYGVSSTPTLVLIDRAGIVRLYHPGRMAEADLEARVRSLIDEAPPAS
jgi:thiol-disulfide isomerase/thioredoxin